MSGSRPLVIALAASAAVNVFLIGGLAGMAFVRLTTPAPAAPALAASAPPAPRSIASGPPAASPPPSSSEAQPAPPPKPDHRATVPTAKPPASQNSPSSAAAPVTPPAQAEAVSAPARPPLISAADGLSPETQQAFRRALNDANKRNRPLTQQARAERQAALAALGASGYDAGEVARRLALARDLEQQARGNVEAALAAFTATLSPQERVIFANGLAKVYAPGGGPRRRMPGPN